MAQIAWPAYASIRLGLTSAGGAARLLAVVELGRAVSKGEIAAALLDDVPTYRWLH